MKNEFPHEVRLCPIPVPTTTKLYPFWGLDGANEVDVPFKYVQRSTLRALCDQLTADIMKQCADKSPEVTGEPREDWRSWVLKMLGKADSSLSDHDLRWQLEKKIAAEQDL